MTSAHRTLTYLALGCGLAICAGGWIWSETSRRTLLERVAKLEAAGKGEASAGAGSAAPAPNSGALPSQPGALQGPGTQPGQRGSARPGAGGPSESSAAEARVIEDLQQRVQDLSRDLTAARDEAARAESQVSAAAAESTKLQAQIEELRESSRVQLRSLSMIEAELKAKSDRLAKAEAGEKQAADRAAKAEAAAARTASVSKELDDLIRRREVLMTAMLRRYRDVTDQYRNFTLNAQTRETTGAGLQAGDLSRIQTAIQQAEDDLRQLQSLHARVTQLATRSK